MAYRNKSKDGTVRIINDRVPEAWPVGAIFMTMDSTDPGTLFGGSWTRMAQGRMLVGVNEGGAQFSSVGEVGGASSHTILSSEMPSHTHTQPAHTHPIDHNHAAFTTSTDGGHVHALTRRLAAGTVGGVAMGSGTLQDDVNVTSAGAHSHTANVPPYAGNSGSAGSESTGAQGGGGPMSIMNPYLAVYIWRRTA